MRPAADGSEADDGEKQALRSRSTEQGAHIDVSVCPWILAIAFDIGCLLAAPMTLPMYGLPADPPNVIQPRYFGSALAGLGFLAWLIRGVNEPSIQRGSLIACAMGFRSG